MSAVVLLVFVTGFILQTIATLWTKSVVGSHVALATFLSMAYAACLVFGLGESLKDPVAAIAYVLGCGAGSLTTMKVLK